MEGRSLSLDDAVENESPRGAGSNVIRGSGVPSLSAAARAAGAVAVVDKHIVQARLVSPLAQFARRDVFPFVLAFAMLVAQALPALLYEAQVWWIRSGEEAPLEEVDDAQLLDDAAAPFATTGMEDDGLAASGNLLLNDTAASAVNDTKLPSAAQLAIDALPVPESYHFYFMYALPAFVLLYVVLWLSIYWNVKLQVFFRYRRHAAGGNGSADVRRASHICVDPVEHGGKSEICRLQRIKLPAKNEEELFFVFQKTKYIYQEATPAQTAAATAAATASGAGARGDSPVSAWFAPLDFPVAQELQSYVSTGSAGLSTAEALARRGKYGENAFDIPLPPFPDLFKEHALAPFFVFQILCVLLWCLDEYWYYSLFTLFMLVMFECTVVKRRLKSLEFMREMRMKPYPVHVYRGGAWISVPTSDLLPGDVLSLVRPANEQHVVPADILLLTGSVVVNESMLTGESTPVQKEALEATADQLAGVTLDVEQEHKRNVLFGGTKILLPNAPSAEFLATSGVRVRTPPPDGGCLGFVLRTGFNTSQGRLVRTILFSSESVSINNTESLLFIGVLLIFAIAASAYVCVRGLEDGERSRYKLMLSCIMIITSVVPPELPMELSLAVNTSLLALMKCNIFCTEPFRIPLAGAVDMCCFDKTGTLTADEFIVRGIAGIPPTAEATAKNDNTSSASSSSSGNESSGDAPSHLITSPDALPAFVKYVIAGCHSLTYLPDADEDNSQLSAASTAVANAADAAAAAAADNLAHLIGDPLEKASLAFLNWSSKGETSSANRVPGATSAGPRGPDRLRCLHKYPFSSSLKRMSCVIALEHEGTGSPMRVVTKGAAEVLEPMFTRESVPHNYAQISAFYSQQGCRVLALGFKELAGFHDCGDDRRRLKSLSRAEHIECGLTFAGFLVLHCPLKKDSLSVLTQLRDSSHGTQIITGDHVLTASQVARELGVTTRTTLILQLNRSATKGEELFWVRNEVAREDGSVTTLPFGVEFTQDDLERLTAEHDLCVSGDALDFLFHAVQALHQAAGSSVRWRVSERMALLARYVAVFARTSPDQKELIVHWLKSAGLTTLFCGDGTNDSSALKQAHIGVALIGEDAARAKPKKKKAAPAAPRDPNAPLSQREQQLVKLKAAQARLTAAGGPQGRLQEQMAAQLKRMEEELSQDENTLPRLGDASIASPFTSKLPYITSCVDIIRQGRCTLVTTLQMFNILGVNCLLSAYSMSVLFLDGVKWGDAQMTIASLSIAMFFLFVSRSEPIKQLSAERPHKKLFTPYMMLSVLGQFALHMLVLLTAINLATPHTPTTPEHKSPSKSFQPNVLNTVVFLVSNTQTVATFAANYRGRPFMQSLRENTALYKSLFASFAFMLLLASETMPAINKFLELHALPSDLFKVQLLGLLLFDVASTYVYAHALKAIFAIKPKKKGGARA